MTNVIMYWGRFLITKIMIHCQTVLVYGKYIFTVSSLDVLRLAELDQHSRGGVNHLHLIEDRGSVVRDRDLALRVLNHLVHAAGAQTGPDGVRESFGGLDIAAPDLLGLGVLGFHEPIPFLPCRCGGGSCCCHDSGI